MPDSQIKLFEKLKKSEFINNFYLAGGTGLALNIGHRQSVDFDFFSENNVNTNSVAEQLCNMGDFQRLSESENTIHGILDEVRISFITYKYRLLDKPISIGNLKIADIKDIVCMKLSAVAGRGTKKDFIDLYYLLKIISLENMFELYERKFGIRDYQYMLLKSLIYFDDAEDDPMPLVFEDISWEYIKNYIKNRVKQFKLN